jgi:hypothetical protein
MESGGFSLSAHAYIRYADVPEQLIESARRTVDGETDSELIQFDGYSYCGALVDGPHGLQIEFTWSRNPGLRHALGDWLSRHGIHFEVVF